MYLVIIQFLMYMIKPCSLVVVVVIVVVGLVVVFYYYYYPTLRLDWRAGFWSRGGHVEPSVDMGMLIIPPTAAAATATTTTIIILNAINCIPLPRKPPHLNKLCVCVCQPALRMEV